MKYYFLLALTFIYSCSNECKENTKTATLVVDITDTTIINSLKAEKTLIIEKLFKEKLKRCEAIKLNFSAIGATVENYQSSINYPLQGFINSKLGNYELTNINTQKASFLSASIDSLLNNYSQTISSSNSQIWYTINKVLQKDTNTKHFVVISDLLDFYKEINFYKDFENTEMLKKIQKVYAIQSYEKVNFKGNITFISPLNNKNQKQVLSARNFYAYYLQTIGINSNQIEFISSITQSKF